MTESRGSQGIRSLLYSCPFSVFRGETVIIGICSQNTSSDRGKSHTIVDT